MAHRGVTRADPSTALHVCVLKLCTLSLEIHLHFWWGMVSSAHRDTNATARS